MIAVVETDGFLSERRAWRHPDTDPLTLYTVTRRVREWDARATGSCVTSERVADRHFCSPLIDEELRVGERKGSARQRRALARPRLSILERLPWCAWAISSQLNSVLLAVGAFSECEVLRPESTDLDVEILRVGVGI